MPRNSVPTGAEPIHVSLVAIPEAVASTVYGIFDVMNAPGMMAKFDGAAAATRPFRVDIAGQTPGPLKLASGVPVTVQKCIGAVSATDIIIVPSVLLGPEGWKKGRYPDLVAWLGAMHRRGALLCSACSG